MARLIYICFLWVNWYIRIIEVCLPAVNGVFHKFCLRRPAKVVDLYYNEDLSLSEIAENSGISRQGVRDVIVRAEAVMQEVEDKTGLIRRYTQMQTHINTIVNAAAEIKTINYRQYEDPRVDFLADSIARAAQALKE